MGKACSPVQLLNQASISRRAIVWGGGSSAWSVRRAAPRARTSAHPPVRRRAVPRGARLRMGVKAEHQRGRKRPRLRGEVAHRCHMDAGLLPDFARHRIFQALAGLDESGQCRVAARRPRAPAARATPASRRVTSTMMAGSMRGKNSAPQPLVGAHQHVAGTARQGRRATDAAMALAAAPDHAARAHRPAAAPRPPAAAAAAAAAPRSSCPAEPASDRRAGPPARSARPSKPAQQHQALRHR